VRIRSTPLGSAAALWAIAALAGCATDPAPGGVAVSPAKESAAVLAVRRVAFDGRVSGYMKVKTLASAANRSSGEGDVLTYWVYDARWSPVGYYTRGGDTFRLGYGGDLESLGILSTERALRVLLGAKSDAAVDLLPLDAPRTLEGDREAARLAAEEAAKRAKEGAVAEGAGNTEEK
jgi:hypothetical protein